MTTNLHNKPIAGQAIFSLAWPAIVTNITTPLMSLIDIAVVGHLDNKVLIAAIALGGTIFNMLYWMLNFLRTGTSGLTAQALGSGNYKTTSALLTRASIIALCLAAVVLCASPLIGDVMIAFMDADSSVSSPAKAYFMTAVWGAPAVILSYALSGWFTGMQDTRPVFIMSLTTGGVNIFLNLLFVMVFNYGLTGVAAATAIAQWSGTAVGIFLCLFFCKKHSVMLLSPRIAMKSDYGSLSRFASINSDIFLRTLCLVSITVWFTRAGAESGAVILGANAILMQFFMLFSFFIDGFAFAAEALAGKFYGAGQMLLLKRLTHKLMSWGLILAIACSAIYFFAGEFFIALLTDNPQITSAAKEYLPWAIAIPLCGFMAFIWDGIYIGLTLTRRMLVSMAAAAAIFFAIWLSQPLHSINHNLWLAFLAYLLTRGIVQTFIMPRNFFHSPNHSG